MTPTTALRTAASVARPSHFFITALVALALLGFSARQAQATIYYVSSTGTGNGASWTAAGSLQTILSAAHSGDQVWVKKGIYVGNFTATNGVAVYGGFSGIETMLSQRNPAANVTTLDANMSGTVYAIPSAATGTNTLDGFTVEGGVAGGLSDPSTDTLVVANCTFSNNANPSDGGAISTKATMATVTNCSFVGNTIRGSNSNVYGAGIYFNGSTSTVTGCTFTSNSATSYEGNAYGGGIYSSGTATITGCTFTGNNAQQYGGAVGAAGAAVTIGTCTFTNNTGGAVDADCTVNTVSACTFTGNSSGSVSGGLTVTGPTTSTVTGCIFMTNSATGSSGGGMFGGSLSTTVSGCTFSGNTARNSYTNAYGGGLYVDTGTMSSVTACTFAGNSVTTYEGTPYGGGIGGFGTPTIADCKFMSDSPDEIDLEQAGTPDAPAIIKDSLMIGSGATSTGLDAIRLAVSGGSSNFAYATIANNTILNTNAALQIGSQTSVGGAVSVANNIFYGNDTAVASDSSVTFVSSHNDLYANTATYTGTGVSVSASDKAVNPDFVRAPNFTASPVDDGDEHLQPASTLINAGDDSYVVFGDVDLDGNPRIQGSHVDLGAYEAKVVVAATLSSISPASATEGGAAFTLTLNGTGFVSGAYAEWKNTALTTTFVSATKLTATVPASLVATVGAFPVTVVNPGAAASNALTFMVTAPVPTWTAAAVSAAPDGVSHILWTRSDGAAGLWTLNASGVETVIGTTYGPFPGWSVKAVATALDGTSRVLWTNVNGMASVWTFSAGDTEATEGPTYGPYSGWTARSIGVSGDGTSRVLWDNVNGEAGVWSFNTADVETIIGPTYGPYSGYTAASLGVAMDGTSRVLWDNSNGMAGLWTLNSADVETLIGKTYGPFTAGRPSKSAFRATARRASCGPTSTAKRASGRSTPPTSTVSLGRRMARSRATRRRLWASASMARRACYGITSVARRACGRSTRAMSIRSSGRPTGRSRNHPSQPPPLERGGIRVDARTHPRQLRPLPLAARERGESRL